MSIYYKNEDMSTTPQLNDGVPPGVIALWSGTVDTIPSGWALCDGTNGTPDLRNRFILGASDTYANKSVGGASRVTLTQNQMPIHSHVIDTINSLQEQHQHTGLSIAVSAEISGGDYSRTTRTTQSSGGGQAHENMPPYMALYFIMKLQV